MKQTVILEIIKENPDIRGFVLHGKLIDRSRVARWFGRDSFLARLFKPSFSAMYAALDALENEGRIRSVSGALLWSAMACQMGTTGQRREFQSKAAI